MTTKEVCVLPGDTIDPSHIPTHPKRPLRLGPGLRHIPPSDVVPTVAGRLATDAKKNSIWVEYNGGRYLPAVNDVVIGQVVRSAAEMLHVSLGPYTATATLPQLSFEGATKKSRPQLAPGSVVYARVAMANRHMDPELECKSAATGRADGLGPLPGGCVFDVSLGLARRLLMGGGEGGGDVAALEALAGEGGLAFETAVGRNGRVWVESEDVATVVLVGRVLREIDEAGLDAAGQRKLVRRLLRDKK